jgi:hypothetical protein
LAMFGFLHGCQGDVEDVVLFRPVFF